VTVGTDRYEIRVKGRLNATVRSAFHGMVATTQPPETVLVGPLADQAALYGVLARVQSLGLELMEIRRVPSDPAGPESNDCGDPD
jgi:hypothetical protein